jgi:hypothetical protein
MICGKKLLDWRILTTDFTTSTDKRGIWVLVSEDGLIRAHPCDPWLKTLGFENFDHGFHDQHG